MNKIWKLIKVSTEVILVIGFIFFEELIWKKLALPFKNWLRSLKALEGVKKTITELDPYPTLVVFIIPLIIAELMGIRSGALVISGHLVMGAIIYAMKIPVAGLTFWVFSFSKDKLLTIDWFKTLYELLMEFISWVKNTYPYRRTTVNYKILKRKLRRILKKENSSKELKKVYSTIKSLFQ